MNLTKKQTGDLGENIAAEYLIKNGYEIVAKKFRAKSGEIDIIAADGTYLVFVEVKTVTGDLFGSPADKVGSVKQSRIIKTAEEYLYVNPTSLQPRFDVILIYMSKTADKHKIKHIADAFYKKQEEYV